MWGVTGKRFSGACGFTLDESERASEWVSELESEASLYYYYYYYYHCAFYSIKKESWPGLSLYVFCVMYEDENEKGILLVFSTVLCILYTTPPNFSPICPSYVINKFFYTTKNISISIIWSGWMYTQIIYKPTSLYHLSFEHWGNLTHSQILILILILTCSYFFVFISRVLCMMLYVECVIQENLNKGLFWGKCHECRRPSHATPIFFFFFVFSLHITHILQLLLLIKLYKTVSEREREGQRERERRPKK